METPVGKKIIYAYDPAIVDYNLWYRWKKSKAIYIITREKDNSAFMILGHNESFDVNDPRNIGVLSDDYIGPSNGHQLRRMTYQDPVTGKIYKYITNQMDIPPGLIAYIYKLRWDVEKIFHEFKRKLEERKAWGDDSAAKEQQANCIALAHNLMIIFEREIKEEEGIIDEKSLRKREARLLKDIQKAQEAGRKPNPLVIECSRITERSLQFIRWLRVALKRNSLWVDDICTLKPYMEKYLC